jgi:hypothetical protein
LNKGEEMIEFRIRKSNLMALALVAAGLACNFPGSETSTPEAATTPEASITATSEMPTELPTTVITSIPTESSVEVAGVFRWAVIVDLDSEPVSREEAQELVEQASAISMELTGFAYEMVDFIERPSPNLVIDLANNYVAEHGDNLPHGIIIFSYGDYDTARTYGGYADMVQAPAGYRNEFAAPKGGDNRIYVSVQHWSHRYAACGYGDSTVETPVQDTSLNGECRNQDGVACVENNGYSMCSTAVDNLYASSRTYFASTVIIHEIMHLFGENGNYDHSSTQQCDDMMASGISERPYSLEGPFDLAEAQYYNGICPYTYDNFVNGYQP